MRKEQDKQPRRRHCMVVHAYYPLGETRVQREAEALVKHNYEVDVVCLRNKGEAPTDSFKGACIYRLPVRRYKGHGLFVQLLEYLAFLFLAIFAVSWLHGRRHYITIQVHNPPDFLVFAACVPKLFGACIILDLHDLMPEFYMGRFHPRGSSLPIRLLRLQERLSCWFANHVITVSEHWRQALIRRGVPAHKCSVLMNVADNAIFRPSAGIAKRTQCKDSLRLIYHGQVTQRYGLDLVLQAMAHLRQKAPGVHLTILGRGDHMNALVCLADELKLIDRVAFHDEIRPVEELPKTILRFDAGVVPYRNDPFTDDLLPTKLMEYAALGVPAIAARTTAIASYLDETMVLFFTPDEPNDLARCILTLYSDPKRLAQLAEGIRKFNQRYDWTKMSAEYVALVERLGMRER